MRKSSSFAAILTGAVALTSLISLSAFADSRHQDETWRNADRYEESYDRHGRNGRRYDDRDFLSGTVERLDRRRGVALVRVRDGRAITGAMTRRGYNNGGVDFTDLRRGDFVTFAGDWSRQGFTAWRIDSVDSGRGHGRGRW